MSPQSKCSAEGISDIARILIHTDIIRITVITTDLPITIAIGGIRIDTILTGRMPTAGDAFRGGGSFFPPSPGFLPEGKSRVKERTKTYEGKVCRREFLKSMV